MTEKRFTYADFQNEKEMLDLLDTQAEVIYDLEEQNNLLKTHLEIVRLHRDILMGKNNELRQELQKYDDNIKSAIQSERTELGSSVLRNLASNLRIEL